MTKDKALDLALEALEALHKHGDIACVVTPEREFRLPQVITAIKQARSAPVQGQAAFSAGVPLLYPEMKNGETISVEYTTQPAAPVQEPAIKQGWDVDTLLDKPAAPVQEPVAWLYKDDWGRTKIAFSKETANEWGAEVQPLYTTPPAAKPAPVQELYIAPDLSTLKHSDNCRYWDESEFCTCGATEYHELHYWKTKALAQPVQEPDHGNELTIAYMSGVQRGKELAAQRQWVGLTDEEIYKIDCLLITNITELVMAIEAKLRSKNGY
jgi:hypothetical protein